MLPNNVDELGPDGRVRLNSKCIDQNRNDRIVCLDETMVGVTALRASKSLEVIGSVFFPVGHRRIFLWLAPAFAQVA